MVDNVIRELIINHRTGRIQLYTTLGWIIDSNLAWVGYINYFISNTTTNNYILIHNKKYCTQKSDLLWINIQGHKVNGYRHTSNIEIYCTFVQYFLLYFGVQCECIYMERRHVKASKKKKGILQGPTTPCWKKYTKTSKCGVKQISKLCLYPLKDCSMLKKANSSRNLSALSRVSERDGMGTRSVQRYPLVMIYTVFVCRGNL